MNKELTAEKHFPNKQHLSLLRSLKHLVDEGDFEGKDKEDIKNAVCNILKKKDDVGTIILGIQPLLMRAAVSHFKAKKYKAAKSALDLLRINHGISP